MLNLLVMVVIKPPCRLSSVSITWSMEIICNHACFIISLFLWLGGVPPPQRCPQIPSFAQTGMPNYDPFFPPLLLIKTLKVLTIKHSMYMWKVPLFYTEMACVVFSSFEICPGRKVMLRKCCEYFRPEGVLLG